MSIENLYPVLLIAAYVVFSLAAILGSLHIWWPWSKSRSNEKRQKGTGAK